MTSVGYIVSQVLNGRVVVFGIPAVTVVGREH